MSNQSIVVKPTSTFTGAEIEGVDLSQPISKS